MFCDQCGTEVSEGSAFCTRCGNPIHGAQLPPSAVSQPWYAQTWVAVAALLLFLPLGLFLMWRFQRWEVWLKTIITVAGPLLAIIIILVIIAAAAVGGDDEDREAVRQEASPSPDLSGTATAEAEGSLTATAQAESSLAATATAEASSAHATATAVTLAPSLTATAEALEAAEIAASAGLTRDNPVPMGQSYTVPEGWEVTVVDLILDATQIVLAENMFNDPPDPGFKYMIVRVRGTNVSAEDPDDFDADFAMRLVGSHNVSYDQFTRSCGVIPDDYVLDVPDEVFRGGTVEGNICFHVPVDETAFVMFTDFFLGEDRRYFAIEQ